MTETEYIIYTLHLSSAIYAVFKYVKIFLLSAKCYAIPQTPLIAMHLVFVKEVCH